LAKLISKTHDEPMKLRIFIVATALATLLAMACAESETELAPTASPAVTPGVDLRAAQVKWDQQGILDYDIEVRRVSTFNDQTHRVSVANGEVAEATAECAPALADYRNPCTLREFDAVDFAVPGLFKIAESQSERDGGRWTSIELDGRYGFPTKISYSNREVIDGWVFWTVTSFKAKP
jgi:hypothetical protein